MCEINPEIGDYNEFKYSPEKALPYVHMVVILRHRILEASKMWIGKRASNVTGEQGCGTLNSFLVTIRTAVGKYSEHFKTFDRDFPVAQCEQFFEKDPDAEERNKLLKQERLVRDALYEV